MIMIIIIGDDNCVSNENPFNDDEKDSNINKRNYSNKRKKKSYFQNYNKK